MNKLVPADGLKCVLTFPVLHQQYSIFFLNVFSDHTQENIYIYIELDQIWLYCVWLQETLECGFTLKCVHDMIRTYIPMNSTEKKYSHHSSIIWPNWLNG